MRIDILYIEKINRFLTIFMSLIKKKNGSYVMKH